MYLKNEEVEKGLVVMIDFDNGDSDPYYVSSIELGESLNSIVYRGESLSFLLKVPNIFSIETNKISDRRHGTGEPNRKNAELKGYRKMTESEKKLWKDKIANIPPLKELINIIELS